MKGTILAHMYRIVEGQTKVAEVSRKWFYLRDTCVEATQGQEDALMLAITTAHDMTAHSGGEERSYPFFSPRRCPEGRGRHPQGSAARPHFRPSANDTRTAGDGTPAAAAGSHPAGIAEGHPVPGAIQNRRQKGGQ